VSTEYLDPIYPRAPGATKRPGPIKHTQFKVVPDATKRFVNDGWLALALFGAVLLFLILQG
jgi:hypothetical protein